MSKLGEKTDDIEALFKSIDTDKSGAINYTEFLASTMDHKLYMKEEKLYEAFKAFDKDGSGKISTEEVKQILKVHDNDVDIEGLIKKFDSNNDGEIDYHEFIEMMSQSKI